MSMKAFKLLEGGPESSKRGMRRVSALYRMDIFAKGTGADEDLKPLRSIITADKDKLKAKRRKLQDRFDILGPCQISRHNRQPLASLASRQKVTAARKAMLTTINARRLKLEKMQRGIA